MNTPKKMTYATALNNVLNANPAVDAETIERLNDLLAQVSKSHKKAEGEAGAKAKENAELASTLLEQMQEGRAYTLAEMVKELPLVAEFNATHDKEMNTQKMTAIVNVLVDAGTVVKETVKRKNYYTKQ